MGFDTRDKLLCNWRIDPAPLGNYGTQFGNVWWDPDCSKWRVVTYVTGLPAGKIYTATFPYLYGAWTSGYSECFAISTEKAWDNGAINVTTIWYEAGETRPWRMLYRGGSTGNGDNGSPLDDRTKIGLATALPAVDGVVTFERIDPAGNNLEMDITDCYDNGLGSHVIRVECIGHRFQTNDGVTIYDVVGTTEVNGWWKITRIDDDHFDLASNLAGTPSSFVHDYVSGGKATAPVIPGSRVAGSFDNGDVDSGGTMKVGDTYYHWYSLIQNPRQLGFATSSDLVNWTKSADNPVFTAVQPTDDVDVNGRYIQGPDQYYDGTYDLGGGFFCCDVVRWDNGSEVRYVMICPHSNGDNNYPSFDVFVSPEPEFPKSNRTFVGRVFKSESNTDVYIEGYPFDTSGCDTPRIVTDTIERNVLTSTKTGNMVMMFSSLSVSRGWNGYWLTYDKSLHGAKFSDVRDDYPPSAPKLGLNIAGSDANTMFQLDPGGKKTLKDLTGQYDSTYKQYYSLYSQFSEITNTGVKLTGNASPVHLMRFQPEAGLYTPLNSWGGADDGDFTIEFDMKIASGFTTGARYIMSFQVAAANSRWRILLYPSDPNYYIRTLFLNAAGSSRECNQTPMAFSLDTLYRVAIMRLESRLFYYINGTKVGPTAGVNVADGGLFQITTGNAPLVLGYYDTSTEWDGELGNFRISKVARYHTAGTAWTDYAPAAFPVLYQAAGKIYTRVYDFGVAVPGNYTIDTTTPAGTSFAVSARNASSVTDQSVTAGDFTLDYPTGRYQQYMISLATTDTSVTPNVNSFTAFTAVGGLSIDMSIEI